MNGFRVNNGIFLFSLFFQVALLGEEVKTSSIPEWAGTLLSTFGPSWIETKSTKPNEPNVFSDTSTHNTLRLPSCFFFDELKEEQKANERIGYLSKMYAACGIRLDVKAFTLKNGFPTDPKELVRLVKLACPFKESEGVRGYIYLETHLGTLPKVMCQNAEATGCSTLCESSSVSVIDMGAEDRISFHESLHGNCCGTLCVEEGSGAGGPGGWGVEFSRVPRDAFENELCHSLRAGASELKVSQWNKPIVVTRYQRQSLPEFQADLLKGSSLLPSMDRAKPVQISESPRFAREPASLPPFILSTTDIVPATKLPVGIPHKMGESLRKESDSSFSVKDLYEIKESAR